MSESDEQPVRPGKAQLLGCSAVDRPRCSPRPKVRLARWSNRDPRRTDRSRRGISWHTYRPSKIQCSRMTACCDVAASNQPSTQSLLDDFRAEIPLSCPLEDFLCSDHMRVRVMRVLAESLRRSTRDPRRYSCALGAHAGIKLHDAGSRCSSAASRMNRSVLRADSSSSPSINRSARKPSLFAPAPRA